MKFVVYDIDAQLGLTIIHVTIVKLHVKNRGFLLVNYLFCDLVRQLVESYYYDFITISHASLKAVSSVLAKEYFKRHHVLILINHIE